MNNQQIEKALKICAQGAKAVKVHCLSCPYINKGCLTALLTDSLRYIQRLKVPRYEEPKKKAKPTPPPKRGKPVSEWLEEERKERERKGEKDCDDIPW
jgi:hypothetical protein